MRFSSALFAASVAAVAAAQTTASASSSSSSGYTCAAQNILDACLGSMQPQLAACQANDWDCMCNQQQNVMTCYNNCPGHPDEFGAQQTETSYCNAAKAYGSSALSKAAAATAAPVSSGAAATGVVPASTTLGVQAAKTGSPILSGATPAVSTDAASSLHVPVMVGGGLLAAFFL